MDVFRGSKAVERVLREPVVAIGNFDGVHVGHQALLGLARARAAARGGEAVVLTFEPHPAKVLAPSLAPPLICTASRKLELLAAQGVDACVLEPFTAELAAHSADEFVEQTLCRAMRAAEVVVGWDFTYGRKRHGNVDSLRVAGEARGFRVHVVPPVTVDGLVVSSTKIRELLHEGKVEGAAVLLGREFDLEGPVVRGAGRGRQLGIPTANIAADNELYPRPGVYAARVTLLDRGEVVPAVVNLGRNPTFVTAGGLSLEAHLLDWNGDLYDRRVRVAFHSWLRGEERFPSAEALVAQIRADIDRARRRMVP
jgi:riboflavin kinase/FMN adenylyltransferase